MTPEIGRITEALRNNEDWAVAEVTKRVKPVIRNKIYSFGEWEDVLQKCLMEVTVAVRENATVENLWGLVKRVAITSVIDHNRETQKARRRTSTRTEGTDDEPDNPLESLRDLRPLADTVVESKDLFVYIYQRVGEKCRKIIDLIYIEGLTYEHAAAELGVTEGALRVRIHRCRDRALQIRSEVVSL